ncbi:MAG: ATPase domain [Chloroflexota bacterium]|jgi:hypothetical protein
MNTQLPFFGRDNELTELHQLLERTATGAGPQVITFVAETGVGKSRIVQQFYNRLTIDPAWDEHNYWPDAFQSVKDQLLVNPEFPQEYTPQ